MAYKNIFYDREGKKVHIWDDKKGHYTVNPYKYSYGFIRTNEYSEWKNLQGEKVKRVDKKWDYDDSELFESDVRTEYRVLLDEYLNKNTPPENLNIVFFDIETAKTETGYSTTDNPIGKITSIAIYNKRSSKGYVIVLDERDNVAHARKRALNYEVIIASTEEDLLLHFYKIYEEMQPDILTGWNIDYYDIPYLYNRTKIVLNVDFANKLSPIGIVQKSNKKEERLKFKIAGVSALDYIRLYKNFTQNEEPSYTLDYICKKELGRGKIQYDGSLYDLYLNDPEKFIEYNVNDVELPMALDDKLDFINLAIGTSVDGYVDFESVFMPSSYIDGAGLAYLRNKKIVADNGSKQKREAFRGGVVLDTMSGLFKWIYDLDLTSLYPSIIRTLNISPETLMGKIFDWSPSDFVNRNSFKKYDVTFTKDNETKSFLQDELFDYLKSNKYSIAGNGAFYRNDFRGFIPSILDEWFALRVEFKDKMKEYKGKGDKVNTQYYYNRQWIQKIKLNTFYGVLALPSYRFNNIINAEAITLTGQFTTTSSRDVANQYYADVANTKDNQVISGDTDSVAKDSVINTTKYGKLSIEELFHNLSENNDVWGDITNRNFIFPNKFQLPYYDEIDETVKSGNVQYIEKHTVKKRMFKIKTKNGKNITITEDHSIMILDLDNKLIQKKPADLINTDRIVTL